MIRWNRNSTVKNDIFFSCFPILPPLSLVVGWLLPFHLGLWLAVSILYMVEQKHLIYLLYSVSNARLGTSGIRVFAEQWLMIDRRSTQMPWMQLERILTSIILMQVKTSLVAPFLSNWNLSANLELSQDWRHESSLVVKSCSQLWLWFLHFLNSLNEPLFGKTVPTSLETVPSTYSRYGGP